MLLSSCFRRAVLTHHVQARWSTTVLPTTGRRTTAVTLEQRTALRAARKERATKALEQQTTTKTTNTTTTTTTTTNATATTATTTRYLWYASVIVPTGLLAWALNDPNSPPAQFSRIIGLTAFIAGVTNELAKPANATLLPDWSQVSFIFVSFFIKMYNYYIDIQEPFIFMPNTLSPNRLAIIPIFQMPNVPKDIPVPHTLVLDLENTLVCSTWDRKYGWRHAKRPGVDQFLRTMAEYYEIVLYSPSIDGVADPAVTSLDKAGCIMHRLYRDATHYHNGTHVKDLNRLNRNIHRIVILDDDELAVQFNPDNLIKVKPYEDSSDRNDRTLERITPFLVELARSGTKDIPAILRQYQGLDADGIADEYERRLEQFKQEREQRAQRGLGGLAGRSRLPPPEATPQEFTLTQPQQLTSKDLVGATPTGQNNNNSSGMVAWMNQRATEKEEQKMLKLEKWNEVMMKKQREKRATAEAATK